MNPLLAVVLVCALNTAPDACTRETALDIVVAPASTPFACMMTGQASAAHAGLPGDGRFAVVRCERRKAS